MRSLYLGGALIWLTLITACNDLEKSKGSSKSKQDVDAFCEYVGNKAEKHYCRTTFVQLLAHPDLFDGRRVLVKGWILEVNGVLAIFPSKDSIDSAELNASIIVSSGVKHDELLAILQADPRWNPRMLSIGGVFRTRRSVAREEKGEPIPHRFGALFDVDEVRP